MIKIQITDGQGDTLTIEARGMLGGALVGEHTPAHKPITVLGYGNTTESDKLSLISAQISLLTADLYAKGLPPEKIAEILSFMIMDSVDAVFKHQQREAQYREDLKR